jgi:hypothetical protein
MLERGVNLGKQAGRREDADCNQSSRSSTRLPILL